MSAPLQQLSRLYGWGKVSHVGPLGQTVPTPFGAPGGSSQFSRSQSLRHSCFSSLKKRWRSTSRRRSRKWPKRKPRLVCTCKSKRRRPELKRPCTWRSRQRIFASSSPTTRMLPSLRRPSRQQPLGSWRRSCLKESSDMKACKRRRLVGFAGTRSTCVRRPVHLRLRRQRSGGSPKTCKSCS